MKMTNFINLYNEMIENKEDRQVFQLEYKKVKMDVFFMIDKEPYLLMIGIHNTNEYFELEMSENFEISAKFDKELYKKIIRIFNIKYNAKHTYSPNDFLSHINNNIPPFKKGKKVKPIDIIKYRRDVEEVDRIYFCGWIHHKVKHVTYNNLEKTRILLGERAFLRCKTQNISTKWCDSLLDEKNDNYFED